MRLYRVIKNIIFFILNIRTVGVRALVIKNESVLLIKHTYMPGWYSIGGAVEKAESPLVAIERELSEEIAISLTQPPQIFNVYYSNLEKRDDYIILYICKNFIENNWYPNSEIQDKRWFKLDELPVDISPATKKRIDEYLNLKETNDQW